MRTVKIQKDKLREIVQENREKHRGEFEKALENYRIAIVGMLEEKLADAKAGKKIAHMIRLEQPEDQTKDYDRVLRMIDLSVDDVLELTESEFAQYVQDDWHWKEQFSMSNMSLASTAMTYSNDNS